MHFFKFFLPFLGQFFVDGNGCRFWLPKIRAPFISNRKERTERKSRYAGNISEKILKERYYRAA